MDEKRASTSSLESDAERYRRLGRWDRRLLVAAVVLLVLLIAAGSRANILVDSIDYYSILQSVVAPQDRPIVPNLHFARQRSPGFPLAAVLPYSLLSVAVEPLVRTEKVMPPYRGYGFPGPRPGMAPPPGAGPPPPGPGPGKGPPPGRPGGLPPGLVPPVPLLLIHVPFHDFALPRSGSWYRWKLAIALAVTSYAFLFLGMAASAWTLRMEHPGLPGDALVVASIFTSTVFLQNILHMPLYATLTAYGACSLAAFWFLKGFKSGRTREILVAGVFLGLLVLTRLEAGVFAVALVVALLVGREWRVAVWLTSGASWALVAWGLYNQAKFGTPVYLGILRGDINILTIDWRFIVEGLFDPRSGILIWSPLVLPGMAALVLSRSVPLRMLGVASACLLVVYLVRVPVMYQHVGSRPLEIAGIPVMAPRTAGEARQLVWADMNRYATLFAPLAILGIRDALGRWWR